MTITRPSSRSAARAGLAALAATALLVTGCGGDDATTTTASTAAAASKVTFKGDPVTIYTNGPLKNAIGNFAEIPAAARAAATAINAKGGLKGHEVRVKACNDTDANAELACARKAKQDDALAFVGSTFILNPGGAEQILQGAKIPNVAPLVSNNVEYTNPTNFPIDGAIFGFFTCSAQGAQATGKKKVAYIAQNFAAQKELVPVLEKLSKAQGLQFVGSVFLSPTQTDFSSAAGELQSKGADLTIVALTPATAPAFLQARAQLGDTSAVCITPSSFSVDDLAKVGAAADGIYVASTLPGPGSADEYPLVQQFVADMKAAKGAGDGDADLTKGQPTNALRTWLGMHAIEQAAGRVRGELTNASLLRALNRTTLDTGGVVPPIDFAKPNAAKPFARVFNGTVRLLRWNAGEKSLDRTKTPDLDALPILTGGS